MRLDQYVVTHHGFTSRTKAADAIRRGDITVNNHPAKPSMIISQTDTVQVLQYPKYVSRSADKLLEAIETFEINLTNQVVLDIGSSTGGFTQVCLAQGAAQVIAVDVGTNQLEASLRSDPRITLHEQTNFKELTIEMLPPVDTTVIDVSFISTILHLPHFFQFGTQWLCLIKPQFETHGEGLVHGVIQDPKWIDKVLTQLETIVTSNKKQVHGTLACRTTGKTGNQEYMVWIK